APQELDDAGARDRHLLAAAHVLDRHLAARAFFVALDGDERHAARPGVPELLAQFIRFGIDVGAQAAAAQLRCQPDGVATCILVPECDHDVNAASDHRRGEHHALGHHDDDPLDTERKPAGRHIAAEKHADQVVITPAAAEAADALDGDLHDRAGVIRHTAS